MTHVKPQIERFQAGKVCQVGFNELQQVYSQQVYSSAFVKRIKSLVHVSVSYVCNNL
jgi:hypothetical protein